MGTQTTVTGRSYVDRQQQLNERRFGLQLTTPASAKGLYISAYRQAISTLIGAMETLGNLKVQADALGYATGLTDADFSDQNAGLTATDFQGAMASAEALRALFVSLEVASQLYKLRG